MLVNRKKKEKETKLLEAAFKLFTEKGIKDTSIQEKRIAVRKLSRIGLNQKYVNLFLKLLE